MSTFHKSISEECEVELMGILNLMKKRRTHVDQGSPKESDTDRRLTRNQPVLALYNKRSLAIPTTVSHGSDTLAQVKDKKYSLK